MTRHAPFEPGIDVLLGRHPAWMRGRRVALLSHPAAVDASGRHALERLLRAGLAQSVEAWGPEHGFLGNAAAGASVHGGIHPIWGVKVRSLYGSTRCPTTAMLAGIDAIVIDLQDLAVRCYTFVSTLRYVLEAAALAGKTVIVADRPVPFANTVDGPMLAAACASFVGAVDAPLVYGMTPGETACWLRAHGNLDVDLHVAPMRGYHREATRQPNWPPWIPPSPGIATWETALCYPATVWTEALPALDCGRTTRLPFQTLTAPGLNALELADALRTTKLPGAIAHPHVARLRSGARLRDAGGIRLTVTDPSRFRPVYAGLCILHAVQEQLGTARIWNRRARPDFFDKLLGDTFTREAMQAGVSPADIAAGWKSAAARFRRERAKALIYTRT